MPRNKAGSLTAKELAFVAAFRGDQTEAARAAGYSSPKQAGFRLMKKPLVRAAVQRKQTRVINASAKHLAEKISITPNEIINIASRVARLGNTDTKLAKNAKSIVAGLTLLADIFGLRVKNTRDVTDDFAGWTPQEIADYADSGKLPDRLRSAAGEGPQVG